MHVFYPILLTFFLLIVSLFLIGFAVIITFTVSHCKQYIFVLFVKSEVL